ncbi:MAG: DNA-directed RNA polymerase subunit beta' [candidate division TM6 bacterium GW2011_GWF2_43_87]|nr:MAG: DNA-directed RNA polymerase subunit beta' [candidate division TM6 bacterium GW2011_GWF2_43_87]
MSNQMLERFREYIKTDQFNAIRIGLASPEKIKSLSYGEVKKIETINYRTLKPERDGLFCARIFGPVKDWECTCGKYKRMKHRGITCEKCGVDVIESRVRRERMGHIALVSPVCHIWYLKGIPSYLGLILDVPVKDLERVVYFDMYMVVSQGKSPYPKKTLLSSIDCDKYRESQPEDFEFEVEIGAEALRRVLSDLDLKFEIEKLQTDYSKNTSVTTRHKIMRRIKALSGFAQGALRPEWMILSVLPVLPPDLRPLVPLEGGRFASSDLNELYRRVLNRNIRLQRLIEIDAPSVIIKNERRMLQESVDALIDNGRRGQPVRGTNKRPLKSLSEMLRGKQGRFRQNLLGKRVDYSGRSVIVVDPELKIDQCGIPKIMALELFKSHVYAELLVREIAPNLRVAKRLVEEGAPEVWDALESVVKGYPVLLNRAPTLHRLGIQAFYPTLVDGKAIKIHPLVCGAYNADFDGDQMAVHVPLSGRAKQEAKKLMLASANLLSAASGKPVATPSQDMVLGLHYLTKARCLCTGEGTVFSSTQEVVTASQCGAVALHARIKVRLADSSIVDTTVGRVLFFESLPVGSEFDWVNKVVAKKDLQKLIELIYYRFGSDATVKTLDKVKKLGFYYATRGGISFSMDKLAVSAKKDSIVSKTEKAVQKVEALYINGTITNAERYNRIIGLWDKATRDIADSMNEDLRLYDKEAFENKNRDFKEFNPIFLMIESKARGSVDQIKQLIGMRGLMAKPSGEIMETPVISNFREGLSVFEYFISTHGARKGQADTALKTANSGYLTRRLVDAAQDVVISMNDCQTFGSVVLEALHDAGDVLCPLADRVYGRVAAEDVRDPVTLELLVKQGSLIGREEVSKIKESAVSKVAVRSVLVCQSKRGVCAHCYGMDLSTGRIADAGATVGIIAAQSIGEPGTQLTMRTFHIGGTASLSEYSSFVAKHEGIVQLRGMRTVVNQEGLSRVLSRRAKLFIVSEDGRELQRHDIEYGAVIFVKDGERIKEGTRLVEWDNSNKVILTEQVGTVHYVDLVQNVTVQERYEEASGRSTKVVLENRNDKYQPALSIRDGAGDEIAQYYLPAGSYLNVESGDKVVQGDVLVKIPREVSRTKDITGGLPRIAELFEARMPKDPAILSDCDGEVLVGGLHRGSRKISVTASSGEIFDYLVPRGKQLNVATGDRVRSGDPLTVGSIVLHDILRILGPDALQRHLVDQIQGIYRLQGVEINDRHIELIVRQMLRKVRITDPGDTDFLIGDRVERVHVHAVNDALRSDGKKSAVSQPMLMGITLASLGTESFFSAASFQETTRILAEAAIVGQIDYLYGLKENVIIGKLIPAGTGIKSFRERYLGQ